MAGDVPQQQQRGGVGPVQIVEHEHDGPLVARLAEDRADGLEQPVALALAVADQRLREAGKPGRELRHEPAQLAAAWPELPRQLGERAAGHVVAQRL
ncbi:MAG: hypothetical protein QOJ89_2156, partial [bacterium]